jgi:hypothetical protein
LTICGNAPLTRLQLEPGSGVTLTGWIGVADGDGDSEGLIVLVADGAADAVADGLSDGPAGEAARKLLKKYAPEAAIARMAMAAATRPAKRRLRHSVRGHGRPRPAG